MNKELGIYIHIPFCKSKCYYCDFISYSNKNNLIEEYINCLAKEIENFKETNSKVTTIYMGGGTPSYIEEKHISKIIETIKNNFKIDSKCEITIEINPGTCKEEKLKEYKKIGINRLSIGLQSTNNKILKQIGRIHKYEEFVENYKIARKIGFKNINIDLIIGIPKQTIIDLKQEIDEIAKLKPEHISVYSLIIEQGTKIEKLINEERLIMPDEELERNMYWYVKNRLELAGYIHYEISNFSKQDKESKHNTNCWEQKEYIGFGAAAHSYVNNIRYSNITNVEQYIKNIKQKQFEKNKIVQEEQNIEDAKKEYMLLGLRKIEGINVSKFKEKYIDNPIFIYRKELDKLVKQKLIKVDKDKIKLTNKGLDLANMVWEEFV